MKGRKPKHARLRLLEQDRDRAVGSVEAPVAPDWLQGDARSEWDRVVPELAARWLVSPVDALTLAAYCETYAMWMKAKRVTDDEGVMTVGGDGMPKVHPAAGLCLKLFAELRRMGAEFGFSPAARSRIDVDRPPDREEDDFERFQGASQAHPDAV